MIQNEHLTVAPGASQASLELQPEPWSVRAARAWVRDQVPPLGEDQALALELLTSELVTNAVLHAGTRLTVGVAPLVDGVLVTVADRNEDPPQMQPFSESRTSGRGMMLLSGMSRRWGVTRDDDGKTVWFVLSATEERSTRDAGG